MTKTVRTTDLGYLCPQCNDIQQHRFDEFKGHWVCGACETTCTLHICGTMVPVVPMDKGPWEGLSVCASCQCELSNKDHLTNKCVCPHCGACSATGDGFHGLAVLTRRKVFLEPAWKRTLWQKLSRHRLSARLFEWEVKSVTHEES